MLEYRIDVAEEDVAGLTERLRNLRLEIGENAELGSERVSTAQVRMIPTRPEEALAFPLLDAGEVGPPVGQEVEIVERVVVPHDAH